MKYFQLINAVARSSWTRAGLLIVLFCSLWLNLVSLPLAAVSPLLDLSWCGAIIHFSAQGLQWGSDVIFTYGPLAHLASFVYTGELFTSRVIWELVGKTIFTAILCLTIVRLKAVRGTILFLYVLLFIWADPISDALFFLVISCIAASFFRQPRERWLPDTFAVAFLAACSLIKFTYFALVILALLPAIACHWSQGDRSRARTVALTFAVTFLVFWKVAGQNYGSLLSYFSSSLEVSMGYKEAMGYPAASNAIILAGAFALLLALLLCLLFFLGSKTTSSLGAVLVFAGAIFLSWNRAFIRADDHVLSFFAFCPVASLIGWSVVRPARPFRIAAYVCHAGIFASCLSGLYLQKPVLITGCLSDLSPRFQEAWNVITQLGPITRQLENKLTEAKTAYALPRVQAEVGRKTIDVLGYEQGIALLNNLNYTARPVFQSYSAYTDRLMQYNTAFYLSPRAPNYVLVKYQPIDRRYPTSEDAGVLRRLVYDYDFLFAENAYLLWKKSARPVVSEAKSIANPTMRFDTRYSLPVAGTMWLELNFKPSFRGRIRNLFYKPPIIEIRVADSSGRETNHRLIASMSRYGFILDPRLDDFEDLAGRNVDLRNATATSFYVHVEKEDRRYFRNSIDCRLSLLPPLRTSAAAALAGSAERHPPEMD